jgi:hypothetical protein
MKAEAMTRIQDISKAADLSDIDSMKAAAERMKEVTDQELHLYLVMRDTLQATTSETRKSIALAQFESDRRSRNEARRLAFMTTFVSGIVGLLGVVLGAWLAG